MTKCLIVPKSMHREYGMDILLNGMRYPRSSGIGGLIKKR